MAHKRAMHSCSRRDFVRGVTTSLVATTVATAVPTALAARVTESTDTKGHYDAIVIGGGFAGVTAARDLSLRGRSEEHTSELQSPI